MTTLKTGLVKNEEIAKQLFKAEIAKLHNMSVGTVNIMPTGSKGNIILHYYYPFAYIKRVGKEYYAVVNKEEVSGQQDKNFQKLLLEATGKANRVIVHNADELIGFVDAEDEWTEEKYREWSKK